MLLETLESRHLLAVLFEFNYIDDGDFGFNDPVEGPIRRDALMQAATRFGSFFDHTATLEVDVRNSNFGGSVGASASPNFPSVPLTFNGFVRSVPEQKIIDGVDPNGDVSDGTITVNWAEGIEFQFGLDVAFNEVDFVSVVAHELTHLIGFLTLINEDGSDTFGSTLGSPGVWSSYDRFLADHGGVPFIDPTTHEMDVARFTAEVTNGTALTTGLFYAGANGVAANGDEVIPIHSPATFAEGSSISHIRTVDGRFTDQTGLMLANISTGGISRRWSPVELAILADLGYTMNALSTGFSIEESSGSTTVSEAEGTDTILVRLDVQPTSDVVIRVASNDIDEATVSPATLTFTPENWSTVQTVTVTGVDDTLADGDQTALVTFSIDPALSDDAFDVVEAQEVSVSVTDVGASAPPNIVIVQSGGATSVSESGTTDTFTIALATAPASNVVLTITSQDTDNVTVSATSITFTPTNFQTPQTITVSAVDDDQLDGDIEVDVVVAVDPENSDDTYDAVASQTINVLATDNEVASILVELDPTNRIENQLTLFSVGTSESFSVALSARPLSRVVLDLAITDEAQATLNVTSLEFTPDDFDQPQFVSVTGVDDDIANGDQSTQLTITINAGQSNALWASVNVPPIAIEVIEARLDFGDAPESYPVTIAQVGAMHHAVGPTLGRNRDVEPDGQSDPLALSDDGSLAYGPATRTTLATQGVTSSIATGDLDGDGFIDVVTTVSGPNALFVLLGTGDATFETPVEIALDDAGSPTSVILADLDLDGALDLVIARGVSNDVLVLMGVGDGTFASPITIPLASNGTTITTGVNQVVAGDVNGDDTLDLVVVASVSNDVTVLIGDGDGTFAEPVSYPSFANGIVDSASLGVLLVDIDDDNDLDIMVANSSSNDVTVLLNASDGTFGAGIRSAINDGTNLDASGPGSVAAGDFNGDGNLDLITANANTGNLTLLIGDGTGSFSFEAPIPVAAPTSSLLSTILAVDLNGDDRLDVVVSDQSGAVYVLTGLGDGTFDPPLVLEAGLVDGDDPFRLAITDLDNDGVLELVADTGSSVAVFASSDDEDGVRFPTEPIGTTVSPSVTIDLRNADPARNILDAWIDFNRDGDWDDVGERIFDNLDIGTTNGLITLPFVMPDDVVAGASFARFRLSTTGTDGPGGFAGDGEVEDHQVVLVVPPQLFDFGDAPTSFPVTLADDGARHRVGTLFLGAEISSENDATPSDDALSDSDDDGVTLNSSIVSASTPSIASLLVTSSGDARLDAWIDFNRDGDWDDLGEQFLVSAEIVSGLNLINFDVPADAVVGDAAARFRLSTIGGLAPTGPADDGEVEDYLFPIIDATATEVVAEVTGGTTTLSLNDDGILVGNESFVILNVPAANLNSLQVNAGDSDNIIIIDFSTGFVIPTNGLGIAGGGGQNTLNIVGDGGELDFSGTQIDANQFARIVVVNAGSVIILDPASIAKLAPATSTVRLTLPSSSALELTNASSWRMGAPEIIDGQFVLTATQVAPGVERLLLDLPIAWQNAILAGDVDNSGTITAGDALAVIFELNQRLFSSGDTSELQAPLDVTNWPSLYFDRNGDNRVTALDALIVINDLFLLELSGGGASGEQDEAFAQLLEFGTAAPTRFVRAHDAQVGIVAATKQTNQSVSMGILESSETAKTDVSQPSTNVASIGDAEESSVINEIDKLLTDIQFMDSLLQPNWHATGKS